MGWTYYLEDNPNTFDYFNKTFDNFIGQCLINKEKLTDQLSTNDCYRFLIKTDGDNDKIFYDTDKFYLKSKFLKNKNFKKRLIDYYQPLGIYVNGPKEIIKRDGTYNNRWIVELTMRRVF